MSSLWYLVIEKTINGDIRQKWLPPVDKIFSHLVSSCVADSSQPKIEATDLRIQGSNLDQWEDIVALTSNKQRSLWETPFSPWIVILVVQRKYKMRASMFSADWKPVWICVSLCHLPSGWRHQQFGQRSIKATLFVPLCLQAAPWNASLLTETSVPCCALFGR